MRHFKARWLWAGLLAIVALSWPFAPQIVAQTQFTWKSLEWDTYTKTSQVFNKVGGDTAYFNVYENAAPGVEVGDTEPGDCNATDGFRGVLWYDTAGADSGLKWCNNEDGSYDWDAIALDADRDGFSNDIDGTPATAATGYDDPVAYQVTTTFSGTDARIDHNGTLRYAFVNESDDNQLCAAAVICKGKGYAYPTSFTHATIPTASAVLWLDASLGQTCRNATNLIQYLFSTGDINATLANSSLGISGVTCIDTRDT